MLHNMLGPDVMITMWISQQLLEVLEKTASQLPRCRVIYFDIWFCCFSKVVAIVR